MASFKYPQEILREKKGIFHSNAPRRRRPNSLPEIATCIVVLVISPGVGDVFLFSIFNPKTMG
jgi:hypothetical protein